MRVYQNRVSVCKNQAMEPTLVVEGVYLSHTTLFNLVLSHTKVD